MTALGPWTGDAARRRGRSIPGRADAAERRRRPARPGDLAPPARRGSPAGRRAVPRRHRATGRGPSLRDRRRGLGLVDGDDGHRVAPPPVRSPRRSRSPTAWSTTWSGCRRTPTAPPSAPPWRAVAGDVVTVTKGGAAVSTRRRMPRTPSPAYRHRGGSTGSARALTAAVRRTTRAPTSATPRGGCTWSRPLLIFVFLLVNTLVVIWFERRVIGRMQQRPGPNRTGPFGLLQTLADGVKLALKEDITPKDADKIVFIAGPGHRGVRWLRVVRDHPDGPDGVDVRPPDAAAADRHPRRRAVRPGRRLGRRLRHRARPAGPPARRTRCSVGCAPPPR